MDYPSFVEVVSYFGLDPVTVWFEYKIPFLAALVLGVLLLVVGLSAGLRRLFAFAAGYRYAFSDNMPFYRSLEQLDPPSAQRVLAALEGESMIYALPAVAGSDVPGFKGSVGFLVLSATRLVFTPKDGKSPKTASFALTSFPDANVKDGKKNIELKLIMPHAKPTFQLLGVSRDHAQELFMKMHALRVAQKPSR